MSNVDMTVKKPHEIMDALRPFLLTHHSSAGSSFLLSLFDGHDQILALPGYSDFRPFLQQDIHDKDAAFEVFCRANPYFFDTGKMDARTANHAGLFFLGERQNEGIITPSRDFKAHYDAFWPGVPVTPHNMINAIYYAFARTHQIDLSGKKAVVFHSYWHKLSYVWAKHFPGSKVLVPLRHPVNAFVSGRENARKKAEIRQVRNDHFYRIWTQSYHVMPLMKGDWDLAIWRLEDIHNKPEALLRRLCGVMGIDFSPVLLETTFVGKKYWGHSPDPNKRIHNFSPEYHRKIRFEECDRVEKVILVKMNEQLNKIVGYEMPPLTRFERYCPLFFFFMLTGEDRLWLKRHRKALAVFISAFLGSRLRLAAQFLINKFSRKAWEKIERYFLAV